MISFLKHIIFAYPYWLGLLPLLWFASVWYWRKKQTTGLSISNNSRLNRLNSWRSRFVDVPYWLRVATLSMLLIAVARPQRTLKEEEVKGESVDIILSIDLSSSMLARDFKPDRLSVSKQLAIGFINKRTYDRIGLVTFAGEAFTQCPLTTDHRVLVELLENIQCGVLEDGTAIGMGLATGVNRLKESKVKSKVLILMTDGVNNAGYVQPSVAADLAKEFGIKVYTIGVGSQGEAITPIGRRENGEYVFGIAPVEIDEALLNSIATQTGGQYYRATTARELERIYAEIDQLEKTQIEVTTFKRYNEEFHRFAFAALFFFLLELLLNNTILRRVV
ncbi:MAG: hypothetical protein RLZZ292_3550 [Bacteroidota bacterium]